MAVTWDRGSQHEGPLVADRNLYLNAAGDTVVEEGHADSASQLVAAGHPINQADADRLGLVMKGDRVEQDRAVKIEEHQRLVDELNAELDKLYDAIAQYKTENATKDIPNTMEAARVALETRHEHALLALNHFVKAGAGKDPQKGESQATSLEPEKSATARDATREAKAAVAAAPTPVELARNAPTTKTEVAPQHPATQPSPNSGAESREAKVAKRAGKAAAKKSGSAKKKSE
jgi:hypothetical protein